MILVFINYITIAMCHVNGDDVPYSVNILREKIFTDFKVFDLLQKFYP